MSKFDFFIIPEIIFSTGIIIAILLSIKSSKLEKMKVDVELGSIKKKDIVNMELGQKRNLRNSLLKMTFIGILLTVAVGIISASIDMEIKTLIICTVIQIIVVLTLFIPFFKRESIKN
ncbi:hypothetical protein PV797_17505 [Clostridiaceae bacterium M8S5]|nr:hypothetical protein PV797_17505 [Clostridiaceae bacterium M8S5]